MSLNFGCCFQGLNEEDTTGIQGITKESEKKISEIRTESK